MRRAAPARAGEAAATGEVAAFVGDAAGTGAGGMLALGAAGASGARFTVAAAAGGALLGRTLTALLETGVGRMRSMRTRAARTVAANGRQLCELAGAAVGLLLLRRASPALKLAEAHLAALRAGLLGGAAGHGVGRLAGCRSESE